MGVTYTIGTLAGLTGLSQHTIRAWERRYNALAPGRTGTNRRIYVDADVERLRCLRKVVESGHSIGQVAHLSTDQLISLHPRGKSEEGSAGYLAGSDPSACLAACLDALERLDPDSLEANLVRGGGALGIIAVLEEVVIPLMSRIETGWLEGSVRISQEHMASAVLRTYLDRVRLSIQGPPDSPRLLVTTPRGQHHELGALMVAIVAAVHSWRVVYLGPNLPSKDIAEAARASGARAVGLSLVYPVDDPGLAGDLRLLREQLGPTLPIIVGGRAILNYAAVLEEIRAESCPDLGHLRELLGKIQSENVAPGFAGQRSQI